MAIYLGDYKVVPTIFPDGTSQVWKLPEEVLSQHNTVTWEFESEAELSHVLQLGYLLRVYTPWTRLYMPFLPYARQDKEISNNTTFSRNVIVAVLKSAYKSLSTIDIHSNHPEVDNWLPNLSSVFLECKPDVVCFPDKGASSRGYDTFYIPTIYLEKDRDQLTGEIRGLIFPNNEFETLICGKDIIIVDDICDGGKTFTEATKLLKAKGASKVHLYTTHGLYTKGTQILFDSGIDRIFNRTGEVK